VRELVSFSTAVFCTAAVKKAAYRYINEFSVEINDREHVIECTLIFPVKQNADDIERLVSEFRKEVLDQDLRESLKKETEKVRNLILAHAFSKTALIADE